jgi:predicted DNA-binding protein YlxM (UPF0122 family)
MSDAYNALPATVQHKNLLFDFYGGLLTEKQRAFFTMHYMDDLSLAEIGEHSGITPQAVADLLKRANRLLDGYEARLGLVSKFKQQQDTLEKIYELTDNKEVRELASEMVL